MKNTMIKSTNLETAGYMTCPTKNVEKLIALIFECGTEVETFEIGTMPLESLPEEVQEKVKSILKAFNEVTVIFEHGKFDVSTGHFLKANYHHDYFVCGDYKQEDVYTIEERRQNFIEEFGYAPCYLN